MRWLPDGTASIQQPTIQPIYNGKTPAELVAVVTGYKDQKAYDIVRNYWLPTSVRRREGVEQGAARRRSSGGGSNRQRQQLRPSTRASPRPSAASGYEVVFVPSWSVFDGRFVNNAWLQEAPDPDHEADLGQRGAAQPRRPRRSSASDWAT